MAKTFTASLAVAAILTASTAFAHDQDVVRDMRGNAIMNSWENCVHTAWPSKRSGCHSTSREARTVYFPFNSSRLTAESRAKLDALSAAVGANAEIESVSIVGYADMIGSTGYNDRLSMKRAKVVRSYLANKGLNVSGASTRALGESSTVSECGDLKGKALQDCLWRDRRVEVELNY